MNLVSLPARRAMLLATLMAAIALAIAAPAKAQTVMVNGQQLNLAPGVIERSGRIFVPLRSIFERLGASVVYQTGTINATKGSTTVSLNIGSTQATVNGQSQVLDVAPFIIGATTYVPLRFVAQSLGAQVDYNSSTQMVTILGGVGGSGNRPPAYPPPAPQMLTLQSQRPWPGQQTPNRFSVISASFSRPVRPGSVRVLLDGGDITSQSGLSASGFSFKPPAPLGYGQHRVRVTGRADDGSAFDRNWQFTVTGSGGGGGMQLIINQPGPNDVIGSSFSLQGTSVAYARIAVTAGPSGVGIGQFSGSTTAGSRGNFQLRVSVTRMPGQGAVTVRVTATDPNSSRTTTQTLQLRFQ